MESAERETELNKELQGLRESLQSANTALHSLRYHHLSSISIYAVLHTIPDCLASFYMHPFVPVPPLRSDTLEESGGLHEQLYTISSQASQDNNMVDLK